MKPMYVAFGIAFLCTLVSGENGSNGNGTFEDRIQVTKENFGEEFLEIWNPRRIANLGTGGFGISAKCEKDIVRYFEGVLADEDWALLMMDADGKPTWGIYSGNHFWTGVPEQCRQLAKKYELKQTIQPELLMEASPFHVAVYSVKFHLEVFEPKIPGSHLVTLGLCLPISCNVKDVEKLLQFSINQTQSAASERRISVTDIRNLSGGFTLWEDKVFYILMMSFLLVTVSIVIGTAYDVILRYKVLRKDIAIKGTDLVHELSFAQTKASWNEKATLKKLWSVKTHNASLDVFDSNRVPKPLSEALLSFSLLLNLSKVGSLSVGSDTLTPIHGIRFFSMLWVILVHTCLIVNEVSDTNLLRLEAENDFLYQTLSNGTYAVDTFFVISGCLVSFLYFRTIEKKPLKTSKLTEGCGGKVAQFLGMMIYRYLRLTPPYLLVIGVIQVSMKFVHEHSMIEIGQLDSITCDKFWWRNALYINTYFPMEERCMAWSWYLANDTQFYTVGILVLIIAASCFSVAAAMVVFFLIASWITTALITLHTEHIPTITNPFAHYESLYDKPWTRIGPYLIGMTVGWYLYKVDCKLNIHKTIRLAGWTVCCAMMTSIVYGLYGSMFGPVSSALYTALSHSGWAICIGWILVSSVTSEGGIVNEILSWKYIYPLSRLTYCAYLLHPAILRLLVLSGESSLHLTRGLMAIIFFGTVVSSYAAALILSLMFEAPMVSLLRIVHPMRVWRHN